MVPPELTQTVLDLPVEDRLELARRLVESVVSPAALTEAVAAGIRKGSVLTIDNPMRRQVTPDVSESTRGCGGSPARRG